MRIWDIIQSVKLLVAIRYLSSIVSKVYRPTNSNAMISWIPTLLSQVDTKIYSNANYTELIQHSTWYCAFLAEIAKIFRRPNQDLNTIMTNQAERMKSKLDYVVIRNLASTLFYDMRDRLIDEFLSAFGLWNKSDYGKGIQLYALKRESQALKEKFGNCAVIGEVYYTLVRQRRYFIMPAFRTSIDIFCHTTIFRNPNLKFLLVATRLLVS